MKVGVRLPRLLAAVLIVCLAALMAGFAGGGSVQAQAPDPDSLVHDIAKKLNCPTCAGISLADCQTDTCMQWKQEIRTQVVEGKSQQQVIDYFVARFGPTVLQEPPKQGVVLALWLLPVILLIAVVASVIIVLRRSTRRKADVVSPAAASKESDDYISTLEEQVGKS